MGMSKPPQFPKRVSSFRYRLQMHCLDSFISNSFFFTNSHQAIGLICRPTLVSPTWNGKGDESCILWDMRFSVLPPLLLPMIWLTTGQSTSASVSDGVMGDIFGSFSSVIVAAAAIDCLGEKFQSNVCRCKIPPKPTIVNNLVISLALCFCLPGTTTSSWYW